MASSSYHRRYACNGVSRKRSTEYSRWPDNPNQEDSSSYRGHGKYCTHGKSLRTNKKTTKVAQEEVIKLPLSPRQTYAIQNEAVMAHRASEAKRYQALEEKKLKLRERKLREEKAAAKAHRVAEAERYRAIEEQKLMIQEEKNKADQAAIEAEKIAAAFQIQCVQNAKESTDSCCICMSKPRDTAVVPCGHRYFCNSCIEEHLAHSPHKQCPCCRAEVLFTCKIFE